MTKGRGDRAAALDESKEDDDNRRSRRSVRNTAERTRRDEFVDSHYKFGDISETHLYGTSSGGFSIAPHGHAVYHGLGHFGPHASVSSIGIPGGIPYSSAMGQPEMVASLAGYVGQLVPHSMGTAMLISNTAATVPHAYVSGQRIAPRELPPYVCLPNKKKGKKEDENGGEETCDETEEQDSLMTKDDNETGNASNSESEESVSKKNNKYKSSTVCDFFMKTGSCAYGTNCKFKHPFDQAPIVSYNSMGLPRRPGEPICQYFMRRHRCAFGHTCKYDHPEPHKFPGF